MENVCTVYLEKIFKNYQAQVIQTQGLAKGALSLIIPITCDEGTNKIFDLIVKMSNIGG